MYTLNTTTMMYIPMSLPEIAVTTVIIIVRAFLCHFPPDSLVSAGTRPFGFQEV